MIVATGIDVAEVGRIEKLLADHGERFTRRVFTDAEIAYCGHKLLPAPHYAARFAAKEAALKMLGTGLADGIHWKEIEVTREPSGQPGISLSGKALERARALGIARVHLSLTHGETVAAAVAIGETL